MISQKFRFHGHGSLKFLFAKGKSSRSKFFAIKFIENPRRKNSRIAVIVSKKVCKSAVKRNRIRRRIYEIVRPFLTDHHDKETSRTSIDLAIFVYSIEVLTAPTEELKLQILPLLREAGLK